MLVNKKEFFELLKLAEIGIGTNIIREGVAGNAVNNISRIRKYIQKVEEINGCECNHVSIDVCANS